MSEPERILTSAEELPYNDKRYQSIFAGKAKRLMGSWPERALRALTVYYERGLKALEELRAEHYEEADALLNLRKAAFHNFRAADYLATQEGYTEGTAKELTSVWSQLEALDGELLKELTIARDRMEAQLVQLSKVRATLGRYRSSGADTNRFEKSV